MQEYPSIEVRSISLHVEINANVGKLFRAHCVGANLLIGLRHFLKLSSETYSRITQNQASACIPTSIYLSLCMKCKQHIFCVLQRRVLISGLLPRAALTNATALSVRTCCPIYLITCINSLHGLRSECSLVLLCIVSENHHSPGLVHILSRFPRIC